MRSVTKFSGVPVALCVALLISAPVHAQSKPAISGIVLTKDGRPLPGVGVWGSAWKECCPVQSENVITGVQGGFTLVHWVPVIHFLKDGLQPLTVVVSTASINLHVVLESATNDMVLHPCVPPHSGERQIGLGKTGLHFEVPKRDVKVLGGKPDTDYVRYVIKPKKGQSFLELWFGPYAMSSEPDEDQFVKSAGFAQRNLVLPDGGAIGIDSWGHLSDGTRWRQAGMLGSGATYTNVPADEANLFDQIINSACFTPYSSH